MSDDDEYVTSLGPACNALLMSLHMARRLLITQIADAKSEGTSTVTLERHLGESRTLRLSGIGRLPNAPRLPSPTGVPSQSVMLLDRP